MRIVVTDSGTIWNHENPYLEQYKDVVLVVCLSGKQVTDKYRCFISPYNPCNLEEQGYGLQAEKYQALASVAVKLNARLGNHDDILFLTDNNPETLYPFYAIKSWNESNELHLCTLSPWNFETANVRNTYELLLNDLSCLTSLFYWDSNDILSHMDSGTKLPDILSDVQKQYGELLPKIIRGIYSMKYSGKKYYFDFASEDYINIAEGFSSIDVTRKTEKVNPLDFRPSLSLTTLGMVLQPEYPRMDNDTKSTVETLMPRLDGKKVCNILREQRIALANANHIPFESVECPSIGACAGTCDKCDEELAYLTEKIMEIPEEQRIYPQFDPKQEVLS